MKATTRHVAEIGDIAVTINAALKELQLVRSYLENRLGNQQDIASVVHQLLEGLEITRARLAVAKIQTLMLSATDDTAREARALAGQLGLLH
jgi:hypothetical protein